jgi:hypothetical protein
MFGLNLISVHFRLVQKLKKNYVAWLVSSKIKMNEVVVQIKWSRKRAFVLKDPCTRFVRAANPQDWVYVAIKYLNGAERGFRITQPCYLN